MDVDRLSFYNIPKNVVEEFKKRLEETEKGSFPQLTDAEQFEIYKLLFKRIQIFFEYSHFYEEKEKEDWSPSVIYTKMELTEWKQLYKRDMAVMSSMFRAAALEADWILRKIVGSMEKMELFKDQMLEEETK